MKPTPEDLIQLAGRLREFLTTARWTSTRKSNGMTFYTPPQDLGIRGKFSIAIPDEPARQGVATFLHGAANSLAELYGYASVGDLLNRAATFSDDSRPTRIITKFIDETTRRGAVPLSSIVEFASNMEEGLYRSAKFKLGGETKENRLIAQKFAKECAFLQTEQGSFIAKVEVPQSVLKQGDLFGGEPLASTEVCSSFFSAIQFLNEQIVDGDADFESQDVLADAITLFDVELLESLTKIVVAPEIETMEFALQVGTQVRTTSTGVLTEEKTTRLKNFLDFIREQLRGENDLDISGTIIELRSRDPEGAKNYIRVVTQFRGDRTFVSAILTNEQYQIALEAHGNKRQVRLKGNGIRLKTQIRVPVVTELTVQ
jgi:hypothetical protein